MLTPNEISALRERSLLLMQPINEFLLHDIARRVAKAGKLTSTAEYQLYRARFLGADMPQIKKDVEALAAAAGAKVDWLFDFVETKSLDFSDNQQLQQITAAYLKATKKDIETLLKTKNIGFVAPDGHVYPLQNAYLKTMDYAVQQVVTGAADYSTSICTATKRLAAAGIRAIPQKSGHSIGIEYAARRYVMNNISAVATNINEANHKAMGANGWEISAHSASAPDHEPYQGRQFTDKEYAELNDFTLKRRIGTLSCKHIAYPIILGQSPPAHSEAQLKRYEKENGDGITYQGQHYTLYQAEQIQRGIENEIRHLKNSCLVAQGLGDPEALQAAQIKLRVVSAEYKRFSSAAGLRTSSARMQVVGFGHSAAGKAAAQYNKFTNSLFDDTLSNIGKKFLPINIDSVSTIRTFSCETLSNERWPMLKNIHKKLLISVSKEPLGTELSEYYSLDLKKLGSRLGVPGEARVKAMNFDVPYIAIHNHPSGLIYSHTDVQKLLLHPNLKMITVVGNNGNIYAIEKTLQYNKVGFSDLFEKVVAKRPDKFTDTEHYLSFINELLQGAEQYGVKAY